MLWALIPLAVVLAVFCYLFFAPFYVQINSAHHFYGIRFHRLAYAQLALIDNSLKINLWIAGWRKQSDLIAAITKGKQKGQANTPKSKKKLFKLSLNRFKTILQSFKINKCYLNIDSGNVQLNGLLYPAFYWLRIYTSKPVGINFSNQNEVDFEIENNFARITKALIFSSIHT